MGGNGASQAASAVVTITAAEQYSVSTNAAAARVRRMEQDGVILGYTIRASPDAPAAGGALEVFIDVRLDADTDYETFTQAIEPIEAIVDAVHMTGPYDYLLHAQVADPAALDRLLRRLKKNCGVAQTQTRVGVAPTRPIPRSPGTQIDHRRTARL